MCQQLCKLSVQEICTFSMYGIKLYQPLSLGVQITFHTTKCYDWLYLELGKYIFSTSNCQSFVVSWKKNYEINWQEKRILLTIEHNWTADCSYFNCLLIRNMTVWLFNDYLYLVSRICHYNRNNLCCILF